MIKTVYEHIYTTKLYPVDAEVMESYVEKWDTYEDKSLPDA